jgi:predicted nucleic acid-binding protein
LSSYDRPYVDSSVFISFIKGEKKGPKGEHDCKAVFGSVIAAAKRGDFRIFTSTLTIAEVHKKKGMPTSLTDQENIDLRPYFRQDYIQLIEVDRDIAERANELCRTDLRVSGRKTLRPNDAIHLASAERAGCNVILAYDPDFGKYKHDKIQIEWPTSFTTNVLQEAIQESLALAETGTDDSHPLLLLMAPKAEEPKTEEKKADK